MIQEHQEKKSLTAAGQSIVLDVEGLSSIAFDITGTFIGTVVFEYTINGTDWYTLTTSAIGGNTLATGATAVGQWYANASGFQKIRIRCTAFTSGSINVYIRSVAGFGGAISALLGVFADIWDSVNHWLNVSLAAAIAGEDLANNVLRVEQHFNNFNISTAVTTVVKSGAGFVDEIIVVGGTLGNVTVYDNTAASGTVLCPTVTPVANGIILKHCTFSLGLTIVTAAATVVTGSFR